MALLRVDGDLHHYESLCKFKNEYEKLQQENDRLKKIIAKELSENDDLGCEFVYVNILKQENKIMREALELNVSKYKQWNDKGHYCDSKKTLQSIVDSSREALERVSKAAQKQQHANVGGAGILEIVNTEAELISLAKDAEIEKLKQEIKIMRESLEFWG